MILSSERPSDTRWTIDNAWAEAIRDVKGAEVVAENESPTDFLELEKFLYTSTPVVTNFTYDSSDSEDLLIENASENDVSDEEVV